MRLIFDARPIAERYTGLGRYTGSLLRALLQTCPNPSLRVDVLLGTGVDWSGNPHFDALAPHVSTGRCAIRYVDAPPVTLRQQWVVPAWVNRQCADLYFYPHFDLPLGVRIPAVFVVHDLIPLFVDGYVQRFERAKRMYFRQMIRIGVRRATTCFAVSQTTRRDILDLVGPAFADRVEVAYEGPVLERPDAAGEDDAGSGIDRPFLLYVGDRRPHKNLERLVDVFATLRDRHGYPGVLVLAGSTRSFGFDLEARVAGRDDVRILGNVSDARLSALYRETDALMLLSEYEGFGLPVVEAARFGRRVVVSDGGALPEVAPAHALVLPRHAGTDEAAARVAAYLCAEPSRDAGTDARFTWEAAARAIFSHAYR